MRLRSGDSDLRVVMHAGGANLDLPLGIVDAALSGMAGALS
jgi:hypothetical protein